MKPALSHSDAVISNAARISDHWGYPAEIRALLEASARTLARLRPRAVLLVGSGARGELTYRRRADKRLEIMSDIELICLADAKRSSVEGVRRELDQLAREADASERFHIDCLVVPRVPQGSSNRGLLWYEAGRTHQTLLGQADQPFGLVTPDRLELGLVNELVLIRLWWLLVHTPPAVLLDGGLSLESSRRERFGYDILRNFLDVASIWLPNEGVYLCSYRERSEHLAERQCRGEVPAYLPAGFPARLAEATHRKLTWDLDIDAAEWYPMVVEAYQGLVSRLVGQPTPDDAAALERAIAKRWSRIAAIHRSVAFRAYSTALTARWALDSRRPASWLRNRAGAAPEALCCLLALHRAAAAAVAHDARRMLRDLEAADDALWRFCGRRVGIRDIPHPVPLVSAWQRVRALLLDPFVAYHRKLRSHALAVRSRLEEQERET